MSVVDTSTEIAKWTNSNAHSNFSAAMIGKVTQYYAGGKIEKNEMGGTCGANGGGESCAQGSNGVTGGK